jgi:hypothetical protein
VTRNFTIIFLGTIIALAIKPTVYGLLGLNRAA